jgi:hypothetical protein
MTRRIIISPKASQDKVFSCDFRHLLIPPNPPFLGGNRNQSPP